MAVRSKTSFAGEARPWSDEQISRLQNGEMEYLSSQLGLDWRSRAFCHVNFASIRWVFSSESFRIFTEYRMLTFLGHIVRQSDTWSRDLAFGGFAISQEDALIKKIIGATMKTTLSSCVLQTLCLIISGEPDEPVFGAGCIQPLSL